MNGFVFLVAVVMVVLFAVDNGDHAPMRRLANHMLELDRRVVDAETVE